MSYNYFNPAQANELAKFQGTFTGIQAANSPYIGVAPAPTSIYNQAGYYALQDPTTGYVHLQQLANDSMYTNQWYDQTTGMNFNFSMNGVTNPQATGAAQNSPYNINIQITGANQGNQYPTTFTGGYQPVQGTGYTQYPWGPGTVVVNNGYGQPQTTGANGYYNTYDPNYQDPEKEMTSKDLQEMVDTGIYDSLEEAYNDIKSQGYWMNDSEAGKLGIYSDEDEAKIQTYIDKFGCTRDEAIAKLGDKIQTQSSKNDVDALQEKIDSMMENGLSRKEAVEYLEELGYEVPDELKSEPAKYSDKDEAKIKAVMEATGCSREEAIEATGVKPKKDGIFTSFFKGVGNFCSNVWNGIKDGASAVWDFFFG